MANLRVFLTLVASVCTAPVFAEPPKTDSKADPKEEMKAFQGNWNVWREEDHNGIAADSKNAMFIDGDEIQFLYDKKKGDTARLKIDATKDPKEIEIVYTRGSFINKKRLGIYRFTSEAQLEIAWGAIDSDKRPKIFSGKLETGAGQSYQIYRNAKFKQDEKVVKEMKRFEGRWEATTPEGVGAFIEDDDIVFMRGKEKGDRAKFLVDPAKNELEIIYVNGSNISKRRIGIYKFEEDTLLISLSDLDSDKRPTKLTGEDTPGAGKVFFIYKKVK
jgi:uncharacterized protein (TIGR03067 family)